MSPTYKRWYDHDPLLLEVIELLKNYQTELHAQAEIFLKKIEEKVSKETVDKLPIIFGSFFNYYLQYFST